MTKPPAACILYGICEGPHIGVEFERTLQESGFALTRDAREADIVVAHSGGCFELPEGKEYRLVLFIGLPYPRVVSIFTAWYLNIWRDFHSQARRGTLGYWLRTTAWNLFYFWNIPHDLRMAHGMRSQTWLTTKNLVLIRNEHDAMCTPQFSKIPLTTPPAAIINLPGHHSDCWENPGPYVQRLIRYQ